MSSRIPQSVADRVASIATMADEASVLASRTVQKINELHRQSVTIDDADAMQAVTHEIERLQGVRTEHQQRARDLTALATSLDNWLRLLPESNALELTAAPSVKVKDGETPVAAVERLRMKIAGLRQEQMRVKAARAPAAELKRNVRAYVDERAARGRPRINTAGGRLEIDFAPTTFSSGTTRHVLDVMCWLDGERMIRRLTETMEAMPNNGPALSAVERDEQLRTIGDDLDRLERQEEFLISRAEEQGQTIARRQRASPAAILGVTVTKAKTKKVQAA